MTSVFAELINKAKEAMCGLQDRRKPSNATTYSMAEAGMGALSVFVMQEPSFLSQQEKLSRGTAKHNFSTLFGCDNIPTPPQIRNLLDPSDPSEFESLYHNGLAALEARDGLSSFKCLGGTLMALDGTQSHSSHNIHCCNCSHKLQGGKKVYYHSVLCAGIVAPGVNEAIALVPEFITPQDGHDKQDCEIAACKRWIAKHKETYRHLNPTILGDDLFSKQSICELIMEAKYHFIFTCKNDSHKTLYEYLFGAELGKASRTEKVGYKRYTYQYRFLNNVPIRDGDDAIHVNWLEVIETSKKTGKTSYRNTFITNHLITASNVHEIARAGRARWHLENENNNTLKTKGYRFEHNYGHGKNNLSTVLATLSILAFLYHTIMNVVDALYIKAKQSNGSRINFFNTLKVYTFILVFASWDNLMKFAIESPDLSPKTGVL
jgi:hypothetical protein